MQKGTISSTRENQELLGPMTAILWSQHLDKKDQIQRKDRQDLGHRGHQGSSLANLEPPTTATVGLVKPQSLLEQRSQFE